MSVRLQPKYKINRRLRVNLWGRPKSSYNKRESGPGQHGQRFRKPTGYGVQLMAKQKLKGYYGNISEKKFRDYYKKAASRFGDTGQNLIEFLEARLDAVVYRAKFVPTVFAARQLVNHGHILVNGKRVNISSYHVRVGDVVSFRERSGEMAVILEAIGSAEREVPDYIEVDYDKMQTKLLRYPSFEEVPYPVQMEPNLVVEYYSR